MGLRRFDAPYASMVHDFAFTSRHLLFPVMPLTASAARVQAGGPAHALGSRRSARLSGCCVAMEAVRWIGGRLPYVLFSM
ncbi:MAG: carotenoid oxygenase family protein [Pararobbsia sp.]